VAEPQTSGDEREVLRTVAHDLANSAFVLKLALESMQEYPPEKEMHDTVKSALTDELETLRKSVEALRGLYRPAGTENASPDRQR
jgi:hypothetical protein